MSDPIAATAEIEQTCAFSRMLREEIITAFESLEDNSYRFQRTLWDYHKGSGGGEIALLHSPLLEKAAVNFSFVSGDSFPGDDAKGPFTALGVSLIAHPTSPHAPTVHFNIRYIATSTERWFGGGYDLTPMGVDYSDDIAHFHNTAKMALEPYGSDLYPRFSQWAARYFFIPHRNRERGAGGLFFDHYNTGQFDNDFAVWCVVGTSFLPAILPIWQKRLASPYTEEERDRQLIRRGHYVEYNLLYDRGTQFGFRSGGNPEAILCSMPPLAKWHSELSYGSPCLKE